MKDMHKSEGAPAYFRPQVGEMQKRRFFALTSAKITLRIILLALLDAFGLLFLWTLIGDSNYALAVIVFLVTVGLNVVFLSGKLYPYKWFSPGLVLMIIMLIYPTLFTVYTAFTNYGDGHLLSKVQLLNQIDKVHYLPEGGGDYEWTGYQNEAGDFALWLRSGKKEFLAFPGKALQAAEDLTPDDIGTLDDDGIPMELSGGYKPFTRIEALSRLNALNQMRFGVEPRTVTVSSLDSAQELRKRYSYDPDSDRVTDLSDGKTYTPVNGTYTADDGSIIRPGYYVAIGASNFMRLFRSSSLRGPFIRVFAWTFVFAVSAVFFSFAFGLFFAIIFDHPRMPAKRIVRSLLLIPYAIPAFISVSVLRGMLQQHIGAIPIFLEKLFGWSPLWLANPFWAKVGIIGVVTWLGYPYMMLICTGALQSLPKEIYEAARIEGANALQQFRHFTLPLLLVSVGPLLIASFAFNFNNFTVIDIYAEGGPPIANTSTPAGHTDILITYIFRLAFSGGRGADFGYASAITIVIFVILAIITALQFRFTRVWEEISENV